MGKKSLIALTLVVLLAGVVVFLTQTRAVNISQLDFSGQSGWLADRTFDFIEDLQFKDFEKASTYHLAETQEKRDIPGLLRRSFSMQKHEMLDIVSYKIKEVDLDRSGQRARVRALVYFRQLGPDNMRDGEDKHRSVEMLYYWFKQENGQWAMELESSLRGTKVKEKK